MAVAGMTERLGEYGAPVEAALAEMAGNRVVERLWARDHTLWRTSPEEITNRLGWLDSPEVMRDRIPRLEDLPRELAAEDPPVTHALLLGMGGSSLAPELFARVFRGGGDRPRLSLGVLDSTVPGAVLDRAGTLDPTRTLFIVSTKSGGTVETLSLFTFFWNRTADLLGPELAGRHFYAVTDPGSSLETLADRLGFRDVFLNDPDIGGRYSALSYFGLVPAALAGVDIGRLLEQAERMAERCGPKTPVPEHPAARLGAVLGELAMAGRDKATLVLSPGIESFGDWVEQLLAESTGKEGAGILPVAGETLGTPEVYGTDRLFVHVRLAGDESADEALEALAAVGHPVVRLDLEDAYDLGAQFFLWEMATAVAGRRLGIHPFDQPDVEAAKRRARTLVDAYRTSGDLPAEDVAPAVPGAVDGFLSNAKPGDYVALQAWLRPSVETDDALERLRIVLRRRTTLAVTAGYGPRFLHSTGQLHKGDGGAGFFLQCIAEDPEDVPIPDEPGGGHASLTFGVLKQAQAMGDRRALEEKGRRVLTLHLGSDPAAALRQLADGLA